MSRRLFVSVDLPPALSDAVAAAQDTLPDADSLRFTDPAQAHVTLTFLGDTEPDRVDAVTDAVERAVADADTGPFSVTVGGLGAFPSHEYISVLWTGVEEGASSLERLHEAVERETTALGFDAAYHDYTPHVTLARMDDARGKAAVRETLREADPTVGTFTAEEVRLKESTLDETGPTYETVASVDL